MAVQDKNGGTCSNLIYMASNQICLDDGKQPMEIYSSGDEHVLKVRKPYTITKQRERWTEEEHKKFLEALTLYGRAWRRIEEHIGTKTAVQIRSHAQKFFSKVVRESNGKTAGSVKPIEIPPPRPKRKPAHPYPRKQVHSFKKEVSVQEQPERSPSPNFSISEHENQSPKSVLSALGSEAIGSTVSNLQNSSPSPVSSGADTNHDPHDESSMKFASCLKDDACIKEGLTRDAPLTSLKLFGRTVTVTDSHRPSESTIENSKASPSETHQEKQNPKQKDSPWPCEVPPAFHYMQLQKEGPKPLEDASTSPVPWWALYGGFQFTFLPLSEQESPEFCMKIESEEKESHKEGSQTDSSEAKIGEKSEDVVNSQRQEPSSYKEKEMGSIFRLRSSDTSADKCMKGFVPYKRCTTERDIQSSGISGEEREDQRIRLCL